MSSSVCNSPHKTHTPRLQAPHPPPLTSTHSCCQLHTMLSYLLVRIHIAPVTLYSIWHTLSTLMHICRGRYHTIFYDQMRERLPLLLPLATSLASSAISVWHFGKISFCIWWRFAHKTKKRKNNLLLLLQAKDELLDCYIPAIPSTCYVKHLCCILWGAAGTS